MPEDELVGLTEIAKAFGVARNSAWRWSRRPEFPEPVAKLSTGPVYRRRDVAEWFKTHDPKGGRPPKRES